ncbi:hypothetical protein LRS06_18970 [Hymenobacter sp. J193]|uniref:hypothetical protein n=1 Tax=Hymenobacter sp. J193 TaxID=2898429 RepID=UPI002151CE64|nr:hypothetical protein [Hymenobacter sp. J193]MCR5889814.1 hypothetical protein [Hymenobacter sp. J193]
MDTSLLSSSKKCPHCSHWSAWRQHSDDRCERCGQLLDPQLRRNEQEREELVNAKMSSVMLIEIKPEDSSFVRFFKYIIRGGQLAFAALLAFMIWVVTALAG